MPENQNPRNLSAIYDVWTRIIPCCRTSANAEDGSDFNGGMEARIADPLWFLTRQWQMGEFKGEDTGSATHVDVEYHQQIVNRINQTAGDVTKGNNFPPLETIVEREHPGWDWRTRVQAGQQLERLIRTYFGTEANQVIVEYRTKYSLQIPDEKALIKLDYDTQRFITVMAGRVIDGEKIVKLFSELHIGRDSFNLTPIKKVMRDYNEWKKQLLSIPDADEKESTWHPENLDYEFSVEKTEPKLGKTILKLNAPSYRNGELDWYTFNAEHIESSVFNKINMGPFRYPLTRTHFQGMPNQRWWAFEDSNIHYSGMDTPGFGFLELLMLQFANHYSDDWASIPISVPLGSLIRINNVKIKDVFGNLHKLEPATEVEATESDQWALYRMVDADSLQVIPNLLFIPPVVVQREETDINHPCEAVNFIRDESANMVWAIEQKVPNGLGLGVDAFNAQRERRQRERLDEQRQQGADENEVINTSNTVPGSLAQEKHDTPIYKLMSTVPDNWIPFIPIVKNKEIKLRLSNMVQQDLDDPIEPMSRLLKEYKVANKEWIYEDAVTRAGEKVIVTKQRLRWVDGETYMWIGRKIVVGVIGKDRNGFVSDTIS